MTAKRSVTWGSTKAIEVRIEVVREMVERGTAWADGHTIKLSGKTIHESESLIAYADGVKVGDAYLGHVQHIKPMQVRGKTIVAVIGKLGLQADKLELVLAAVAEAVAEAETDPEVVAYRKAEAARDAAADEADRNAAEIERVMTLDGTTY